MPCNQLRLFSLAFECKGKEISEFITYVVKESSEIEVFFKIRGIHSKQKKCGVRMVYKQDLEEMDQTGDEQQIRPASSNFSDASSNNRSTGNNISSPIERKWLNDKASLQWTKPFFCRDCQAYIGNDRLLTQF
ncbi:hypothetical protein ERO13_D01G051550v2 [Gossypium hirsutum]|nr:hypothetical protein ERO13_D01G051550v2 [Gossypium hirsutum]